MVNGKKIDHKDEIIFKDALKDLEKQNFTDAKEKFINLLNIYPKNINLLKNLSLTYFKNLEFYKARKVVYKIIDNGHKNKEIIEFLLLILKKLDKADEIIKIINDNLNIINPKYKLLSIYERPVIPNSKEEIKTIRKNTIENIDKILKQNIDTIKVDENYLDPPIFSYSYDNHNNLEISKKFYSLFRKFYMELNEDLKIKKKNKSEKINIGFVSEFLNNHTIEKLFKGLIVSLNPKIFDVKIFYINGESINKNFISKEITDKNLVTIKLPSSLKEKAQTILNQNLDILFYPDIGMSSKTYYLTFFRLAQKQITSWGHPETTGNPNIDYYLSSSLLEINISKAQSHYSEKLLLSDYLPMYFYKPKITPLNDEEISKKNIYSCPQTLFKIHPDFDEIIIKILKQDSKAKFYLISDTEKTYSQKIIERLKKKDPSNLERLVFLDKMSNENYIHHCGRASVLLDPLYFGAGNSFHESMFYGTQTVSMPTHFLKSRIVLGAYKQMEVNNPPIVNDIENYIDMTISLANMSSKLILERKKYYAKCAEKNLFENEKALQSIEKILINIVK